MTFNLKKQIKIAVGGSMGVGKDTFFEYLINKNLNFEKISFAQPIYEILHYAQEKLNFEHIKDRKFLQFIGTDWARQINPNIWIDLVDQKTNQSCNNFCITDLRFENEFNYLKNNGWILIKIERNLSKEILLDRNGNGIQNHCTENGLKTDLPWDFIINNNSSLEEFYNQINLILDQIL